MGSPPTPTVPGFIGPLSVSVIASVFRQASGKVEEATVRDRILVSVTIVERKNLPSQTSTTRCIVPASGLCVKDRLCKRKPLGLIRRRIRKVNLSSRHRCQPPKSLIVVSLCLRLVWCHVVVVWAYLKKHCLCCNVIIGWIPSVLSSN